MGIWHLNFEFVKLVEGSNGQKYDFTLFTINATGNNT